MLMRGLTFWGLLPSLQQYYRTERDPSLSDYDIHPQSRWELIWFLLQPLLGLTIPQQLWRFATSSSGKTEKMESQSHIRTSKTTWHDLAVFALVQIFFFAMAGFNILLYIALVVVPGATIMLFLSRLRTLLEHGDPDHDEHPPQNCGRITLSSALEQMILSPLNFNYHYWHHKYPALPSAQLPQFHNWYLEEKHGEIDLGDTVASSFGETLYHFYSVSNRPSDSLSTQQNDTN
jgi:fatty acid desaturase